MKIDRYIGAMAPVRFVNYIKTLCINIIIHSTERAIKGIRRRQIFINERTVACIQHTTLSVDIN